MRTHCSELAQLSAFVLVHGNRMDSIANDITRSGHEIFDIRDRLGGGSDPLGIVHLVGQILFQVVGDGFERSADVRGRVLTGGREEVSPWVGGVAGDEFREEDAAYGCVGEAVAIITAFSSASQSRQGDLSNMADNIL